MADAPQTVTVRTAPRTRDIEARAKQLMLEIVKETNSGFTHDVHNRWAELFKLVQPPVLNILRYVFGIANPEDQDDMFQEVMLRLYRYHLSYDLSRPLLPWLYAIARNVKRDRNAKSRQTIELPTKLDTSEQTIELATKPDTSDKATLRLVAKDILAKLPEEDRHMLWLFYYEGMSAVEISEHLNIPLTTAKYYLHRARERARNLLTGHPHAGTLHEA